MSNLIAERYARIERATSNARQMATGYLWGRADAGNLFGLTGWENEFVEYWVEIVRKFESGETSHRVNLQTAFEDWFAAR